MADPQKHGPEMGHNPSTFTGRVVTEFRAAGAVLKCPHFKGFSYFSLNLLFFNCLTFIT